MENVARYQRARLGFDIMSNFRKHIVIIGGGAAGFFAAINCAQKNPEYRITILEQSSKTLQKVKISGGGRCNVTHACFDNHELVKNYPRGEKQLLSVFSKFNPTHTIEWFEQRGVELKAEEDGRMFPITDESQTIIDCFWNEVKLTGVSVFTNCTVDALEKTDAGWIVKTNQQDMAADAVLVAAGSSLRIWKVLETVGHSIVPTVASLFTFNIQHALLTGLQGLSVKNGVVELPDSPKIVLPPSPLLITHWGISGPAVLKLSAFAARELATCNYRFPIKINWCGSSESDVLNDLIQLKQASPRKNISTNSLYGIPTRLWERICQHAKGISNKNYADASKENLQSLAGLLTGCELKVNGKSTFKEEFVTAGGVDLSEIDFKTMQSKKIPGLYFAGEVLDIDAITGGFNFQAAWSTAWVAAQSM